MEKTSIASSLDDHLEYYEKTRNSFCYDNIKRLKDGHETFESSSSDSQHDMVRIVLVMCEYYESKNNMSSLHLMESLLVQMVDVWDTHQKIMYYCSDMKRYNK